MSKEKLDDEIILTQSELVVKKIKDAFIFLRRKSRELSGLKSYKKSDISKTVHYKILSSFQKCGIIIPTYLDKNIDVETIIYDCKDCLEKSYPDLYNILNSNAQGSRDILTTFYSGPKKSYIKLYWLDIVESDAYKDMSNSEIIILLDMMRVLNFKSQTKLNICKTGFIYTFYDCKANISIDTFKRAIPKIVEKGFFTVRDKKKGRMNVYFPCADWKNYKNEKDSDIKQIEVFNDSKIG